MHFSTFPGPYDVLGGEFPHTEFSTWGNRELELKDRHYEVLVKNVKLVAFVHRYLELTSWQCNVSGVKHFRLTVLVSMAAAVIYLVNEWEECR